MHLELMKTIQEIIRRIGELTTWSGITPLAVRDTIYVLVVFIAFIPTMIAVFAFRRPFQVFAVIFLNIASIFGIVFASTPWAVFWLVTLVIAIMVFWADGPTDS